MSFKYSYESYFLFLSVYFLTLPEYFTTGMASIHIDFGEFFLHHNNFMITDSLDK